MAPGENPPIDPGEPYVWNEEDQPPEETRQLWIEVAAGVDKNQTVVWKSAVESLDQAYRFLDTCEQSRVFVERYMGLIIGILIEQQPAKIGQVERGCVEDSLERAIFIIVKDIEIQHLRKGECKLLDVLACIFNRKKAYYKGSKSNWNANLSGVPEARMHMIERFRGERGFSRLAQYLSARVSSSTFPPLEFIHQILTAVYEALPNRAQGVEQVGNAKEMEQDAILVSRAVMEFISNATDAMLKKFPHDLLNTVRMDLQRIFDRLVGTHRKSTYAFYEFWRQLTLKLILSQSLPLRLFGWDQVTDLIAASADHRPPPKAFIVSGAGCTFVNGPYKFVGTMTKSGYVAPGSDVGYVRSLPSSGDDKGKKLTLFRCVMRSQQKWWFLSEADEEQPGTDKDIDYYQHKSKPHEEREPPPAGWVTCRSAGVDPPPTLKGRGIVVPPGEEYSTLEHQLAKWAIENSILMHVLGDSIHREVVSRSTPLIKFLASMCERDEPVENMSQRPNAYCLHSRHLQLAWKTCTSKTDAAVSDEVYQLLVSILPSLPNALGILLIGFIQTSLKDKSENRDYLFETAEFCSALASANPVDPKAVHGGEVLSNKVRKEVLQLLWDVLVHPDAESLKSYENLKRYFASELRIEPEGSGHRSGFLESCRRAMTKNAKKTSGSDTVNEALALRMVKLTMFFLEASPRVQAVQFVNADQGALPTLFFNELKSYLTRHQARDPSRKSSTSFTPEEHSNALRERLKIIRFAFGLSEHVKMSGKQVSQLWKLATSITDREAMMVFVADASSSGHNPSTGTPTAPENTALASQQQQQQHPQQNSVPVQSLPVIGAAFSDDVRTYAFQELFCSSSMNWNELGEEAYRSFQKMFEKSDASSIDPNGPALNALWRICLVAGKNEVASQAMKDLLSVYVSMSTGTSSDSMQTDLGSENFGKRVFDCLVEVKRGLEKGDPSSERSAERCLRMLNAAVGDGSSGRSVTPSMLASFSSVPEEGNLSGALTSLPHGMRSQSCYRKIGIMAKRTSPPNQNVVPGAAPKVARGREENMGMAQGSIGGGQTSGRNSPTLRFHLDVHPLETLASVKAKVASYCKCPTSSVKPISVSGRLAGNRSQNDSSQLSLNVVPDDSLVDQLGIVNGCEMVFVLNDRQVQPNPNVPSNKVGANSGPTLELSEIFHSGPNGSADRLFDTLLGVLESLPESSSQSVDTRKHVWDLLLAMPTNIRISKKVRSTAEKGKSQAGAKMDGDAMIVDPPLDLWTKLLDLRSFHHSVYVMQVIDSLLQPAPEVLCSLPSEERRLLEKAMQADAASFRIGFIHSGGFDAVVKFFSGSSRHKRGKSTMANAVALRILKCCLFGNGTRSGEHSSSALDEAGTQLLHSLSEREGLLKSLVKVVVDDEGISSSAIADVQKFLRQLFRTSRATEAFISLPNGMAEQFLITLILWEGGPDATSTNSAVGSATKIRKNTQDLILSNSILATRSLPWLISAMDKKVNVTSDSSSEYFAVLRKLVQAEEGGKVRASPAHLRDLGTTVCSKLASCPRPTSDSAVIDYSTGVLCGCLKLLRALIEIGGGAALRPGTTLLLQSVGVKRWSDTGSMSSRGLLGRMASPFRSRLKPEDVTLIDLMGGIFDGFLTPGGSSSVVSVCCDKESRQLGFDIIAAAARSSSGSGGYFALVSRIEGIIGSAAPFLRHRWGHNGGTDDGQNRSVRSASKYSGLRNQGCTCYMNSVLQQLFMMPGLRTNLCSANIPSNLRTSGGGQFVKGSELLGKKISLQWDSGVSYDAIVEGFDESTGMHTIRYCPMQVATVRGTGHQQVHPDDVASLPREMPYEFFLSEGRPGKETGVFEVVDSSTHVDASGVPAVAGNKSEEKKSRRPSIGGIEETEDEASSRHLLEEVQRTFIHLDEGSRGRCFDPRAFVEACNCLKLEFDVWQQNDASEFAMKLLDRLEIALKRWAPSNFKYLEHTFGLKQTKQKLCKECKLKTNREENLMSIDCQIRGKSDIHEALSTMCDVEYMEGDNKVFCDRCKKNTDTVLRTAISALPDMLILSLKRFDLDYNTFETVKLNSRCAFGQTLNMKRYTLEGVDAMEQASVDGTSPMDTDDGTNDPLSSLPDEDYEYKLAGVLVHAGVAQGGHYYSFIRDRFTSSGEDEPDKWYRFDDDDVTPFDPSSIEVECFGGKVKKETKFSSGQVHTVESEQFANALMVFYEKVKPAKRREEKGKEKKESKTKQRLADQKLERSSGYDVFESDVRRSNATHRWQTFLFDAEFQSFLKGLLGLCLLARNEQDRMDVSSASSAALIVSDSETEASWRTAVVQMLLSFVYDILLYSADKGSLDYWVRKLSEGMESNRESAKAFLEELARKTKTVSANWLRTYLTDCPEPESRVAASRIFCAAIRSCAASEKEQAALARWSQAWRDQIVNQRKISTRLEGEFQHLEDLNSGNGSTIGVIISFLTALLEVSPRTWRYNSDFCLFLRDLSCTEAASGGNALREALVECQIPSRLVCLVTRERSPTVLKTAFPGESAAIDVVESQIRSETSPTSHLMPLSGNQLMNTSDVNSRSASPSGSDYVTLFETLGCILRVEGVKLADLVVETPDASRGRHRIALTDAAADALRLIFRESKEAGANGMGRYDIEAYLQVCGVDSSTVPPQRIVDILAKYHTADGGSGSKGGNYLSVDGFLAYYRDTAQTNEARVRSDLHTFGFRPDLTRRSRDARLCESGGQLQHLQTVESVAVDVASSLKQRGRVMLGQLADHGLQSFHLFAYAYSASEILAEHVLAASAFETDTTNLINNTLKALFRAPAGWAGNEIWNAAVMILKIICALPDSRQKERIALVMHSPEKATAVADHGMGLLVAAKKFYGTRSPQHFSNDDQYAFDRYMGVIKELFKLRAVSLWMSNNRQLWTWMERELVSTKEGHPSQQQIRGEMAGGREGDTDHQHSDSDMPGMQDSDDEDEEDFVDMDSWPSRATVYVERAGIPEVNGVYEQAGTFDGAGKYLREGTWNKRPVVFSLFRCHVSDNSRRWYISVVPKGLHPGTNTDIDFYTAPAADPRAVTPPVEAWGIAGVGVDPPPKVRWSADDEEEEEENPKGRPNHTGNDMRDGNNRNSMYI